MLRRLRRAAQSFWHAQLDNVGLALHRLSLGAHIALHEDDPIKTYMESGPSLFCSCCGERWHAFSHAACPNGCPWIYTSFRAPAWAADEDFLDAVQEHHRGCVEAPCDEREVVVATRCWPTTDGKIPRA